MNTKTKTWLGVFIIIIIVITVEVFFWQASKKGQNVIGSNTIQEKIKDSISAGKTQTVGTISNNDDGIVKWNNSPKIIENPKIFTEEDIQGIFKTWEVGEVIVDDSKKGDKIILVSYDTQSPGGAVFFRFIQDDKGNLEFLKNYSSDNVKSWGKVRDGIIDGFLNIRSLEYPGLFSNNGNKFIKEEDYPLIYENLDEVFFKPDSKFKKSFTDPIYGDFYENKTDGGFYVRVPDGTYKTYSLEMNILDEKGIPKITWNDGTTSMSPYTYKGFNGCGDAKITDAVASTEISTNDLISSGKAADGSVVYYLKDKNYPFLTKWYQETSDMIKNFSDDSGLKFKKTTTYEQFLAMHPLFFWKDPMGRMVRFMNKDLVVTGGCGKPVIYLYPEKETPISVNIKPAGGMTASDPDYGQGWNVIADSNSNIKNLADGKNYPYLFWEGRGNSVYNIPKYGFVVSRNNLSLLLDEKLAESGLIPKEISDFKEFWLPKMLSENKPYYFVTFIDHKTIDKLAPLEINPVPDTVIRVLMDYKGLSNYENVPGFEIKTPERRGFTTVEWGGVLK